MLHYGSEMCCECMLTLDTITWISIDLWKTWTCWGYIQLHTKLNQDKDTRERHWFTTASLEHHCSTYLWTLCYQSHSFLNTMNNKNEEIAESWQSHHLVKIKSSAQWRVWRKWTVCAAFLWQGVNLILILLLQPAQSRTHNAYGDSFSNAVEYIHEVGMHAFSVLECTSFHLHLIPRGW